MNILTPGFASPHEAQACFRAVLTALSRPGVIVELPGRLTPPDTLSEAAAAILLTLTDAGVTVAAPAADDAMQAWLSFHTGARFTSASAADFIVCPADGPDRPPLASLRQGTHDEPEHGATLVLDVANLSAGRRVSLTGPGIETRLLLDLPLRDALLAERTACQALAPCGVDILLCAGRRFLGLPRSTLIEVL